MVNKKAQILGLSYQMLFSIFLIATFIYVGIYGIRSFLDYQNNLKLARFVEEFRVDLEKTIATTETSILKKYDLPTYVTAVCFTQDAINMEDNEKYKGLANNPVFSTISGSNVIFYPLQKKLSYAKTDCIKPCLNLSNLPNPYCKKVKDGMLNLTVSKTIGDPYIRLDCSAEYPCIMQAPEPEVETPEAGEPQNAQVCSPGHVITTWYGSYYLLHPCSIANNAICGNCKQVDTCRANGGGYDRVDFNVLTESGDLCFDGIDNNCNGDTDTDDYGCTEY
jgi:hypothetical protein